MAAGAPEAAPPPRQGSQLIPCSLLAGCGRGSAASSVKAPHSHSPARSSTFLQSKVGPFGACVTREGSWCNYISIPNAPEGGSLGGWLGGWVAGWLGQHARPASLLVSGTARQHRHLPAPACLTAPHPPGLSARPCLASTPQHALGCLPACLPAPLPACSAHHGGRFGGCSLRSKPLCRGGALHQVLRRRAPGRQE